MSNFIQLGEWGVKFSYSFKISTPLPALKLTVSLSPIVSYTVQLEAIYQKCPYYLPGKTGRQDLIVGSLPTHFIATRSHERKGPGERRQRVRKSDVILPILYKYRDFQELEKDLSKVKAPWVTLYHTQNSLIFGLVNSFGDVIVKVSVDESLGFVVEGGFKELPDDHPIYEKYKRTVSKKQINVLLNDISQLKQCRGITDSVEKEYGLKLASSGNSSKLIIANAKNGAELLHNLHSRDCSVLLCESDACTGCKISTQLLKRKFKAAEKQKLRPVAKKAPLTRVAKDRLVLAIRTLRDKEKKLEEKVKVLEAEIATKGVDLEHEIHSDFTKLLEDGAKQFPENSFQNLFWKEQKKAFARSSKGQRWHPMMIRFALHLHLRSPAAYRALKESSVVKLPSERTLRDYSSIFHPAAGFKKEVFADLRHQASKLEGTAKYVVLMLDELSVQDDLVFNSSTNELIGFVNLGEEMNQVFQNDVSCTVATHALVFMVCGIASRLKFSLGYFATTTATSGMLYPLTWRAVGLCEGYAGLKVIAVVSDKASSNQKLYRMLSTEERIAYKAINVFAMEQSRPLFMFSDPPHLIKTVRNNLANSGHGKKRLLWNESEMTWDHIISLYEADRLSGVRKLPKLRNEHIYLTPYSKMRVNLAAQVMSETLGKVMLTYGPAKGKETAKLILMIDKFFDCCNTRSLTEGERKRKPFLKPYTSIDDERFEFIKGDFLNYLTKWKKATDEREGNFTPADRGKMFISKATFEGLQTTAHALVECVQFLLQNGFQYVLTNKFSQDPLEDHFGRHRGLGRRSCNPTVYALGHQENKLRLQRTIATSITPKGNTKGSKRPKEGITITTSPLKRRKK